MKKSKSFLISAVISFCIFLPREEFAQTQILKWQDGKAGCLTLTYDDGSINQFRIALPLMNERKLPATFFINTGNIPGSKYKPVFVGRPIQTIINESTTTPTGENNFYERCSVLYYLSQIRNIDEAKNFNDMAVGEILEEGNHKEAFEIIDNVFVNLRKSKREYKADDDLSYSAGEDYTITWDDLRKAAEQGHEIGNHTITHPYLPVMDKANILYQVEKCKEDIYDHLGFKHTLSIECPYGIEDDRVIEYVMPEFPFVRNRLSDSYIKEILRGNTEEPVSPDKEYVQWQRGPLADTTIDAMKNWVDVAIKNKVWLLLVIHGVEGIGWEALPKERLKEYFNYIKTNEAQLWVATFQDAFKYIRERMNAKADSKNSSNVITVTLSHDLDERIYNLPLTLETEVPADWQNVSIQQGGTKENFAVQKEGSIAFVRYRAVPNKTEILISKNN